MLNCLDKTASVCKLEHLIVLFLRVLFGEKDFRGHTSWVTVWLHQFGLQDTEKNPSTGISLGSFCPRRHKLVRIFLEGICRVATRLQCTLLSKIIMCALLLKQVFDEGCCNRCWFHAVPSEALLIYSILKNRTRVNCGVLWEKWNFFPGFLEVDAPSVQLIDILGFQLHCTWWGSSYSLLEMGPDDPVLFSSILYSIEFCQLLFLPVYCIQLWWLLYWFIFFSWWFEYVEEFYWFAGKYGDPSPSGKRTYKVNGLAY